MNTYIVKEHYHTTMIFNVEAESEDEAMDRVSSDLSESDAEVERHYLESDIEQQS